MKVPVYLCVIICGVAFGFTYWIGVSDYDFVSPPEGYDESVDPELLVENPPEDKQDPKGTSTDEGEGVVVSEPPVPQEPIEPADEELKAHPSDYLDQRSGGVDGYVALAERLVAEQKPEHSLVAWERVLDSAEPSQDQIKRAFDILKLHKPVLRNEASGISIAITLHASVPSDMMERATQLLRRAAAIIELGSGYSLSVTPDVSIITVSQGKPRPTMSVWFSGRRESPRGNFRTNSPKDLGLDSKLNEIIFNIVAPHLEEHTDLLPVTELHNEIDAEETLAYLITRHSWRTFGLLLYADEEE